MLLLFLLLFYYSVSDIEMNRLLAVLLGWFSTGVVLILQGTLETYLVVTTEIMGWYWQKVDRGKGCNSSQDRSLQKRII